MNINEDDKRGMLKNTGKTSSFKKKNPKKESGIGAISSP
jgi:hypothetical protein